MELKPFLGVMITISAIFASVTGSAQSNKKDKGLQYGKPSEGFRLAVQPKTTQVRVHEDALLQLSIKNVTKNVLLLGETSPEHDYYIDIRNSRGDAAKITPFGQSLYHGLRKDYRNTTIKVQPGQELKAEIDIGKTVRPVGSRNLSHHRHAQDL
jgi:hypothetical protein